MRRRHLGFTMIEVVVAFVMLCLVLSVGFEIFSTGMSRAGDLGERSQALDIAQSQLASAGTETPMQQGQARGDSADGRYHWITTITPTEEGFDPKNPPNTIFMLYHVEVRVDWATAAGRPQQLTLATMALGQRPQ